MQAPTTFAPRPSSSSWSSSCSPPSSFLDRRWWPPPPLLLLPSDDDDEPAFDRVAAGIAAQGTPAPALWDADTEAPRVHGNNGGDAPGGDDAPGRDEVVKLARAEKRGGVPYYKVYWASGRPTEEPLAHLDGVDPEWIAKADAARGNKAVLLTGARKHGTSCALSSRKGLTSRPTASLIQAPQHCVLNSLRNLLGEALPQTCADAIEAMGASISVSNLAKGATRGSSSMRLPFMLQRLKGVQRTPLLDYLARETTSGKYLLMTERGSHCIAVDADRRLVMESDPAFPHPQPLSAAGFEALKVQNVHSCRRVVPKKAPSRKRKRCTAAENKSIR